jgi:uncharacterized membrane protein YhaH (DUF805 family)
LSRFPLRLFAFHGRIRPPPYALWSLAIFFSQHLIIFVAFQALGQPLTANRWFYVMPLRSLVMLRGVSDLVLISTLAYLLIAAWALAALAFRRAADADISEWIAAWVIAPIVQIPVILLLCFWPPGRAADRAPIADDGGAPDSAWAAAAVGTLAGIALTLFAVAVGALLFGVYGFGLFVASPFVIGAITGYFANRKADIGAGRTARLVMVAVALGGAALIAAALEGIVCIILAAPLGLPVALLGGLFGHAIAMNTRRPARETFSAFAVLPLLFAVENSISATTSFDTDERIAVNAPTDVVWNAIVHMEPMDAPRTLPFRLGVAYPLGGEIIGEGVGALRRGAFSTGTAIERVTEWVPDRKLAFVVLTDVPAMRELSPYPHVHAPHVVGYFRTAQTSFEVLPRANGGSEIIERSSHQLKLEPVFYWLPLARWIVHANSTRVLAHIRDQAEAGASTGRQCSLTPCVSAN